MKAENLFREICLSAASLASLRDRVMFVQIWFVQDFVFALFDRNAQ
jgi:hypothetical protein